MSTTNEFLADLNRVAGDTAIWVDRGRLIQLIGDEIEIDGARCVNLFKQAGHKHELLLITSVSTWSLQQGLLNTKALWTVRHDELEGVRVQGGLFRNYVYTNLVLQARGQSYEFHFGFFDGSTSAKAWRDMAEHNAGIAQTEIERLLDRGPTVSADPALERIHRGMALAEAGPQLDTESSAGWTQADYAHLVEWMRAIFDCGQQQAVWARRVALGNNLRQGEATQEQWFWIHALPALAGLNLGLKDVAFLSVCAGNSDRLADSDDVGQMAAKRQINRQFFG